MTDADFTFDMSESVVQTLDFTMDAVFDGESKYPSYSGEYTVIPKVSEIVLPTAKKSMEENLTIKQIPYAETTNPSGGKTVTIGLE